MDKNALNKKLAEWAGFKQLPKGRSGWHYEHLEKVMNWMPPDVEPQSPFYSLDHIPNFTGSLDACFRWLVPKLKEEKLVPRLQYCPLHFPPTDEWTYVAWIYRSIGAKGGKWMGQILAKTAPLALCLAIESLIDSESK